MEEERTISRAILSFWCVYLKEGGYIQPCALQLIKLLANDSQSWIKGAAATHDHYFWRRYCYRIQKWDISENSQKFILMLRSSGHKKMAQSRWTSTRFPIQVPRLTLWILPKLLFLYENNYPQSQIRSVYNV